MICQRCKFAIWDYEEYYNSPDKQWFVDGCIKDCEEPEGNECEEYEENV